MNKANELRNAPIRYGGESQDAQRLRRLRVEKEAADVMDQMAEPLREAIGELDEYPPRDAEQTRVLGIVRAALSAYEGKDNG